MVFHVEQITTGPIETNTYILSQENGKCIIFDPSSGCEDVLEYIKSNKLTPEAICITHAHFDHCMGIPEIEKKYPGITIWIHPYDKPMLMDSDFNGSYMIGRKFSYNGQLHELHEGKITIGSFIFTVLHIPGHSPGGVAFIIDNFCFSGDSLFAGSVGRTDFPGCDGPALFKNIKDKLFALPDNTIVYSGHGGRTTIGREKRSNPFFR